MFIIPTQPQTAWQVVKSGFGLWKSTFKFVWPFSMVFATLSVLFQYVDVNEHLSNYLVALIVGFNLVANTLIMDCIHRNKGHQPREVLSWLGILRKTCLFFIVYFLRGLMIFFGMVLFIIPGIILLVNLYFAPYLVIIDDRGICGSISASFKLVSKCWWFTAIRLLVLSIIAGLCLLAISLIAMAILAGWYFLGGPGIDLSVFETDHWMRLWIFIHPFMTFVRESDYVEDFFTWTFMTWTFMAFFTPLLDALILTVLYDLRLRKTQTNSTGIA